MQQQQTQGFTLIELLVVIAIIGVLAAILLPGYREAQKKPYDVAALQCGKAIVTAETTYRIANGTYASDPTVLGPDVQEMCAQKGVQIMTHATVVKADTPGDNNLGGSRDNYAFQVYSPNGSGSYRYWLVADDSVNPGNRLNKLSPWGQ